MSICPRHNKRSFICYQLWDRACTADALTCPSHEHLPPTRGNKKSAASYVANGEAGHALQMQQHLQLFAQVQIKLPFCPAALNVACLCLEQARLVDSNRNLAAKVLLLLGQLARAIGPAFDRQGRFLLSSALLCLSDNKHQVACSSTCCQWMSLLQNAA